MPPWLQRSIFFLLISLIILLNVAVAQPYRIDTLARAPLAQYPVAIGFVPGETDHFFFTEKNSGRIREFDHVLKPDPFAIVPVDDDGEQGLLGITLHPGYPAEPYVYVFYTRLIDRSNVVVRFREEEGAGIDPVIIQIIPRQDDGSSNNGGAIHFGPDGKLYVAVGDYGTNPANAQDITSRRNYRGKILRLNPDGSIPPDNPLPGTPFWSYGHRNPAGFTFDVQSGKLYSVEGGVTARNQVFAVPRGGNLGWPSERVRAGGLLKPLKPLFTFPAGQQPGLTSVIVYRGESFPRLRGKLLFGGYAQPTIWSGTVTPDGDSLVIEPFFRSNAGYADIAEAHDGSIVFTNGPYISSRILKISPTRPGFSSRPITGATEHLEYVYTPSFSGTPPRLILVEGPPGMTVDTMTWSVQWRPTWSHGIAAGIPVRLRAENGAGSVEQEFSLQVVNVNDPPGPFSLREIVNGTELTFLGVEPEVLLRWDPSVDPDDDTLQYTVQLDTAASFNSPARRDTTILADSLRLVLSRHSATYHWRVIAGDGTAMTASSGEPGGFTIVYMPPTLSRTDRERVMQPVLEQNFPNPFNPSTSIKYSVQRPGFVRLAVYNLLGQEVAVLVEGVQTQGAHEVEFQKADLPSGIYFYRLQAPGLFETKKMMITK
jgi:glucose/arabinose dehydrogenase